MNVYGTLNDLLGSFPTGPPGGITFEIQSAFISAWGKIHGYQDERGGHSLYPKILISCSGGADSDIVMDMIERIGHPYSRVKYVFYDTALEFEATKQHLVFLEKKYDVRIERRKAKISVPLGVRKYGVPFLSKRAGCYLGRLQKHGFQWENRPFEELSEMYPNCRSALRWWCDRWGENSRMNINRHPFLKEFIMENPPDFQVSDGCCTGAKKLTSREVEKEFGPDLMISGVRKAEGGIRATAYKSCFDSVWCGADRYRPLFWFRQRDREIYERVFGIVHSDCYSVYGLGRTGCACCPFGRNFEKELEAARKYEPKLYAAAVRIFGNSYSYTMKYREYARSRNSEKSIRKNA